jgi:hypothetical protein
VVVTIEDNGIGIEPQHRERVFDVFERLHGQDSYAGTGVGLAIVRRGVERMGGSVAIESNTVAAPASASRCGPPTPRGLRRRSGRAMGVEDFPRVVLDPGLQAERSDSRGSRARYRRFATRPIGSRGSGIAEPPHSSGSGARPMTTTSFSSEPRQRAADASPRLFAVDRGRRWARHDGLRRTVGEAAAVPDSPLVWSSTIRSTTAISWSVR